MATDSNNNNVNDKAENVLYVCFGFFPLILAFTGIGMVIYGLCVKDGDFKETGSFFIGTGWGGTGATLVQRKFGGQKKDEPS